MENTIKKISVEFYNMEKCFRIEWSKNCRWSHGWSVPLCKSALHWILIELGYLYNEDQKIYREYKLYGEIKIIIGNTKIYIENNTYDIILKKKEFIEILTLINNGPFIFEYRTIT